MAAESGETVVAGAASRASSKVIDSSSSLWDRLTSWASEHKTIVYTIAGITFVATSAGVVYYLSGPSSAGEARKSKRERRKLKKEAQEAAQKGVGDATAGTASSKATAASVEPEQPLPVIDESTVETFSEDQRKEYSAKLKAVGNKAFGSKNYNEAIELYTKAILCRPDPIFYSNRSACYAAMADWSKVIEDTTAALALDSEYVKALNRRAKAYEEAKMYSEALLDYTASCIIDNFKSEPSSTSVERLLKKVAEEKARVILSSKENRLPSPMFMTNYLQSFRKKPLPEGLEDSADLKFDSGKGQLRKGLNAMAKRTPEGYQEAADAFDHALELGDLGEHEAYAYNLRGTFRYLKGDNAEALEDLTKSVEIQSSLTQSYIKRASMYLEAGSKDGASSDFEKAIEQNKDDPDIYYHRAQLHFILGEFADAAKDYQKSIDLDKDFIFSHIQLGVTQYKMGSIASSMATFRRCRKNFPQVPDVFNYYGELLLDQQKWQEAIEQFDHAVEVEKQNKSATVNVLPIVNKALAVFQWKQDFAEAENLCSKALSLDPECDIAVATLAQLLLQQGKVPDALKYFERAAELSRTEGEIVNALSYAEATRTQMEIQEKYPQLAARIQAQAMGAAPPGMR